MCSVQSVFVGVVKELVRLLISSIQKLPTPPSPVPPSSTVPPPHDDHLPHNTCGSLVGIQVIDAMDQQRSLLETLLAQYDVARNMETEG